MPVLYTNLFFSHTYSIIIHCGNGCMSQTLLTEDKSPLIHNFPLKKCLPEFPDRPSQQGRWCDMSETEWRIDFPSLISDCPTPSHTHTRSSQWDYFPNNRSNASL